MVSVEKDVEYIGVHIEQGNCVHGMWNLLCLINFCFPQSNPREEKIRKQNLNMVFLSFTCCLKERKMCLDEIFMLLKK